MAEGLPQGFPATVLQSRDLIGETLAKESAIQSMQPEPVAVEYSRPEVKQVGGVYSPWTGGRKDLAFSYDPSYYIKGSNELGDITFTDETIAQFQKDGDNQYKALQSSYNSENGASPNKLGAIRQHEFWGGASKGFTNDGRAKYDKNELERSLFENGLVTNEEELNDFMSYVEVDENGMAKVPLGVISQMTPRVSDFRERADVSSFVDKFKPTISEFNRSIEDEEGVTEGSYTKTFLNTETGRNLGGQLFTNISIEENIDENGKLAEDIYFLSPVARTLGEEMGILKNTDIVSSRLFNNDTGISSINYSTSSDKAQAILDEMMNRVGAKFNRKGSEKLSREGSGSGWNFGGSKDKSKVTVVSERGKDGKGYVASETISYPDPENEGEIVQFQGRGVELPKGKVKIQVSEGEGEPKEYNVGRVFANDNGEMVAVLYTDISDYEKLGELMLAANSGEDWDKQDVLDIMKQDNVIVRKISDRDSDLNAITAGFSNYVNGGIKNPNDLVRYIQEKTETTERGDEGGDSLIEKMNNQSNK